MRKFSLNSSDRPHERGQRSGRHQQRQQTERHVKAAEQGRCGDDRGGLG
jgi:hypothetical protein